MAWLVGVVGSAVVTEHTSICLREAFSIACGGEMARPYVWGEGGRVEELIG